MTITLFRGPPATIPGNAPVLAFQETVPYRAAALHARRVIPGPVGELIQRELTAYADFGYRFATDGLIPRLAAAVLAIRPDERRCAHHCEPDALPAQSTSISNGSGPSRSAR